MATQIVDVLLQAKDRAEYDKFKTFLPKLNLPAVPVFNDLLMQAHIKFSGEFELQS